MTEPDFLRIAKDALPPRDHHAAYVEPVMAALRQVWNARGAADLATLKADNKKLFGVATCLNSKCERYGFKTDQHRHDCPFCSKPLRLLNGGTLCNACNLPFSEPTPVHGYWDDKNQWVDTTLDRAIRSLDR